MENTLEDRIVETVVSATDAKNNLGALLGKVAGGTETVIVERQGRPRAAIISIDEYRQFRAFQQEKQRREAIERFRRLRDEISQKFSDLSQHQIEALAQEIRDDAMQRLVEKQAVSVTGNG